MMAQHLCRASIKKMVSSASVAYASSLSEASYQSAWGEQTPQR